MLGSLHRKTIYHDFTMAKTAELLGHATFFVYDDPEKGNVLKTLITKVIYLFTVVPSWRDHH